MRAFSARRSLPTVHQPVLLKHTFKSGTHFVRATSTKSTHGKAHLENEKSYEAPAASLNHDVTEEEKIQFDRKIAQDKSKVIRSPWHREGSDKPPVSKEERSAGAMTKGRILTTPTRLFKLVLPLTTNDHNSDRKDAEPLALLMHPSQPLSYLERLIQAELPLLKTEDREKTPDVNFRAEDADAGEAGLERQSGKKKDADEVDQEEDKPPGELVRWSKSTEIGDFIRDAARGKEFAVEIEGAPHEIRVGVPSFSDRTYYLRIRLRKKAQQISNMADIKKECDLAAHRYSQSLAYMGFGSLAAWGAVVAWLTFMTSLGWDTMEPVTYLVGLAGLLGGYGWFLLHNREASYKSAMNITVSRRQHRLYEEKGFDLERYNFLIDEAHSLRREIRAVANEYDVDWNESSDIKDEGVVKALKKKKKESKKKDKEEEEDDDDDD